MKNITILLVLLCAGLSGCAGLIAGATATQTIEYCDQVTYTRKGNAIRIELDCTVPVDVKGFSLPKLPGGL